MKISAVRGQRHGLILDYDAEFLGSMFMGMLHRTITDNLTNSRPLPDVPDLMHLFLSGAAPPRHKERRRRITRTKRSVPATVRDGVANVGRRPTLGGDRHVPSPGIVLYDPPDHPLASAWA